MTATSDTPQRLRPPKRPSPPDADELLERLQAVGLLPESLERPFDGPWENDISTAGDACARPTPGLGVNNVVLDFEDGSSGERERGAPEDVLRDLADLGAGFGRQLGPCDLLIGTLFNDRPIPPPDEILAKLRDDRDRFIPFTRALLYAMTRDVALTPTLFCWGGGSALNEGQDLDEEPVGRTDVRWPDVGRGRPAGQHLSIIPSALGWDEWYWDFSRPRDPDLIAYQRVALNLHDYQEHGNARDAEYMAHAAARKRLAVAAYGMAIGEYLALLERALGRSLWRGIHTLELGNEFDTYWSPGDGVEFGRFLALLAGTIRVSAPNSPLRAGELSSWTLNRYRLQSGGGSFPDSRRETLWTERMTWLKNALEEGIEEEVQHWGEIEDAWAEAATSRFGLSLYNSPDLSAALGADVFWPPLPKLDQRGRITQRFAPSDPRRFLQQVGFHYYHTTDEPETDPSPNTQYEGELRLMSNATRFDRIVVQHLNALGWNLTWSVCETSFPSTSNPITDPRSQLPDQPKSTHASELMQASVLIRRLLCLRAVGASAIAWHAWMAKPKFSDVNFLPTSEADDAEANWLLFSGSGLRLDLWERRFHDPLLNWSARNLAYPRSAWFSFRRLAWLLRRSSAVERSLVTLQGLVVIGLESHETTPFFVPDDDASEAESAEDCGGEKVGREFRYCYVLWMDQFTEPAGTEGYASTDTAKVTISGATSSSFAQLPLVPAVARPATMVPSPPTNNKGYPSDYTVDWRWSGWDWATVTSSQSSIEVTVERAHNKATPNPVCILTNHDQVSSS